ncbi:MAG: hypothetical protein RR843_12750, partial [Clostridia bacterium]
TEGAKALRPGFCGAETAEMQKPARAKFSRRRLNESTQKSLVAQLLCHKFMHIFPADISYLPYTHPFICPIMAML